MPSLRIILVACITIAVLLYMYSLVSRTTRTDGFADLAEKTNTFTLYYMNGCPHCESILPDYKNFVAAGQLAQNGKKTMIRMLEQSDPDAAPELEANNVKGFPTFILNTADNKNIEYQGDRTISAMTKFIEENAV